MNNIKFTVAITTKNRLKDLKLTLFKIQELINRKDVECIVYDDASSDGTFEFLKSKYPKVNILRNTYSRGLIYNRNKLNNISKGEYIISLDDDAHFLSKNVLEEIDFYFKNHAKCGVIAFRIFWGKKEPLKLSSEEKSERVKGFVGCGHAWRKKAWESIPNYPAWFVFYGEEEFASYQLFKKQIEVHYVPSIFINHRVDVKKRKFDKDYYIRQRRSLRSGWYLFMLFYPKVQVPRRFVYTLWVQLRDKVFKVLDFNAFITINKALFDVLFSIPKLITQSNRLSKVEFKKYNELSNTKIYWIPN